MSYTRNFEFRASPEARQRHGRFSVPTTGTRIVIGAPVKANLAANANELGLQEVALATGAQAPVPGACGIAIYEYIQGVDVAGTDPYLSTYSDYDTVPLGKAVQVVNGREVKVVFRNTSNTTFLNTRAYTGRVMVNQGGGATPNVAVGDYLTPGTGDDTNGYWAKTATAANGWLLVTKVDTARGEVEAQMQF